MNVGEIIKQKIIEGENKIRKELHDAFFNGNLIIVDYDFDNQVVGYSKSNCDNILILIDDILKNKYKYTIKKVH